VEPTGRRDAGTPDDAGGHGFVFDAEAAAGGGLAVNNGASLPAHNQSSKLQTATRI